ncbi:3-hydroxybutyryl-CoA dehydrogenase, partial [Klebsiella aerogenes]
QLAEICAPSTLLTSNTSSISITAIAAGVKNPERVAGLHFFNPAPVMK